MLPDPQVISELRALFKGGAAVSRLVRHIVARHENEPQIDRLVRAYFREAFCISMFRASASLLSNPPESLSYAGIGANVIHQMVERRGEWDQETGSDSTWMGSVKTTHEGEGSQDPPAEFASVWGQLDEMGKSSLKRMIGESQYLCESVGILSRLVEQLQTQIVALEENSAIATPYRESA